MVRPRPVLVVEDHPDGREALRLLLEMLGYPVEVAVDGVEGVAKALALQPALALVDIGLPRLDGYQVARHLRASLGRAVTLVACTAYGQPQDRLRALGAGFDGFLVKPVDLEELSRWLALVCPLGGEPAGERGSVPEQPAL
jgi:CheY-like chemotaxis protein